MTLGHLNLTAATLLTAILLASCASQEQLHGQLVRDLPSVNDVFPEEPTAPIAKEGDRFGPALLREQKYGDSLRQRYRMARENYGAVVTKYAGGK